MQTHEALGPQVESLKMNQSKAVFGSGTRSQREKVYQDAESEKTYYGRLSPGPCAYDARVRVLPLLLRARCQALPANTFCSAGAWCMRALWLCHNSEHRTVGTSLQRSSAIRPPLLAEFLTDVNNAGLVTSLLSRASSAAPQHTCLHADAHP